MKYYLMIVSILSLSYFIGCQKREVKERVMPPEKVDNWMLAGEPEHYDGKTIFDYIDGAGEVYLAYNFRRVDVYRYTVSGGPEVAVEVYDMGSDRDAYGIFSYTRKEEQSGIGNGYDYLGSLLCFWKGRYFINITTEEETPETRAVLFDIARDLSGKIGEKGEKPSLITALPDANLDSAGILYFHAFSVLNNEYYISPENILNLDSTTEAVLGKYAPDNAVLLVVKYESNEKATVAEAKFVRNYIPNLDKDGFGTNDKGKSVGINGEGKYLVVVLEAVSRDAAEKIMTECRKLISQLELKEK
ncbi:conserved hypothetical protein [Candidatus Zixiibacteriota bacterium]|nr:conserved hypothetical protein [candidate division Zixibacteria bacterium]